MTTEPSLDLLIGDRTYSVMRRVREGQHIAIVSKGDLVAEFSVLHFGEVIAMELVTATLKRIEQQWAEYKGPNP